MTMNMAVNFYIPLCLIVALVCVNVPTVQCDNILIAAEYGGGSHFLAATRVGKALVSRGHRVTLFISRVFEFRTQDPDLAAHFDFELFDQSITAEEMSAFFAAFGKLADYGQLKQMFELIRITQDVNVNDCDAILGNAVTMGRLRDANFSAVLFDIVWPCGRLIAAKLGDSIRTVGLLETIATSMLYQVAGIPLQPAFVPEFVSGFPQRMTFFQRVQNSVLTFMTWSGFLPIPTELSKYDPLKAKHEIRSDVDMQGLLAETDLWLHNADNAVDFYKPQAANVIPVGGLTTGPAKSLNRELEEFMQSSGKHGVVVFTLGSYLTSIKSDIIRAFVDVMSELDQKVVWHVPDELRDTLTSDLPTNVMTMPWIPQNDLLGHPNTRLLIFHGGNNGLYEAVYHAVPVVIIPIFADQYDNAARVRERGLGVEVRRQAITKERLSSAARDVLFNSKYKETALRVSAILRDRPQRPADRGAFWVEHVIAHGGAYMRSPVHDLNFFQLYLIDVITFLLLIGLSSIYVMYKLLRLFMYIVGKVLPGSKQKSE